MPTQAWQLYWLFRGKWKTQDEMEDVGGAHLLSRHLTSCLLSPSHTRSFQFLEHAKFFPVSGPAFVQAVPSACRFSPPHSHHLLALLRKVSCLQAPHTYLLVFPHLASHLFLS